MSLNGPTFINDTLIALCVIIKECWQYTFYFQARGSLFRWIGAATTDDVSRSISFFDGSSDSYLSPIFVWGTTGSAGYSGFGVAALEIANLQFSDSLNPSVPYPYVCEKNAPSTVANNGKDWQEYQMRKVKVSELEKFIIEKCHK